MIDVGNAGKAEAPACVMVIFGGCGDLAKRKLIPSVYHLLNRYLLSSCCSVLAVDIKPLNTDSYRDYLTNEVSEVLGEEYSADKWGNLINNVHYAQGDFNNPDFYQQLSNTLQEISGQHQCPQNYLFYLSIPPSLFAAVAEKLHAAKLFQQDASWRRVIIEKPFGHDLQSALELNRVLHTMLEEEQIYRIDHYLGKETVQNILAYRFSNSTIEPIWNFRYIDHVQITVSEVLGVETRAGYYEESGALRDMIPNHLLTLLSLIAMEPFNQYDARSLRDEQAKVLRAIQLMSPEDVLTHAVRGQYAEGTYPDGKKVPAYRNEPGVATNSKVETYAALRLTIDSWRWADVPFYIRTGKRMPGRYTEIVVQYKQAPNAAFQNSLLNRSRVPANKLVLRIQPNEGISMSFNAKQPGEEPGLATVDMNFSYADYFGSTPSTGYETLILDAMQGDATLFKRSDSIELSWEVVQPVLDVWAALPARDFPNYAAGSWGPKSADEMLRDDGREWNPCRKCDAQMISKPVAGD